MTYLIEITNKLTGSSAIYEVGCPHDKLMYKAVGTNRWQTWGIWRIDWDNRYNLEYKILVPNSTEHFLASL